MKLVNASMTLKLLDDMVCCFITQYLAVIVNEFAFEDENPIRRLFTIFASYSGVHLSNTIGFRIDFASWFE